MQKAALDVRGKHLEMVVMPLTDAFKHLQSKHAVALGNCNVQKQNLMGGKFAERF